MPWARIPPDKLINLPLFGIDVIQDDGDFVWMRGPSGRIRVWKKFPRVFFETVEDAMQCGALGIRVSSQAERDECEAIAAKLIAEQEAAEAEEAATSGADGEATSNPE